jgi:hypothetical protein
VSDSTGLCSICYGNPETGERKLLPIQDGPDGVRVCPVCDGDAFRVALDHHAPS